MKCYQCGKCFTHSESLKKHNQTNSGEKPFECNLCDECFTEAGNLKEHKQIHEKGTFTFMEHDDVFSISELLTDIKQIKQE